MKLPHLICFVILSLHINCNDEYWLLGVVHATNESRNDSNQSYNYSDNEPPIALFEKHLNEKDDLVPQSGMRRRKTVRRKVKVHVQTANAIEAKEKEEKRKKRLKKSSIKRS